MTPTCNDGFVIPLGLPVHLQVICGGHEVFHANERAQRLEKLAHKLRAVFCEQKAGNFVCYDQMVEENRRNLWHSSF